MDPVIAEFRIDATDFAFGDALLTAPSMRISIEKVVPTGTQVMPYLWVTDGDFEAFEEGVRGDSHVQELELVEELDGDRLYRVTWSEDIQDLIYGISESEGVILAASGDTTWQFRIRFPSHEALRRFHDYVVAIETPLDLDRVYSVREGNEEGTVFDLTQEQHEALVVAARSGYFSVPRETTIEAIADELGISDTAASERLRRGLDSIVRSLL